ncbi:MAG: DnaJ C-terminal domain-containing protein [Commensalibacter sp.]
MNIDPYKTLGVSKTASADEIRKAYRNLAKKHHPDLNPGDKKAEEQFKAIGVAYALLSDPDKRARFDRGEIDVNGQEQGFAGARGAGGYRQYADGNQGYYYSTQNGPGGQSFSEEDLNDIFSMFGGRMGGSGFGRQGSRNAGPLRGEDRHYSLDISFLDSVNGTTSRITLPQGGELDVKIPPGIEDGKILRLREKGSAGFQGGKAGDALITIHVQPHPQFVRDGNDIRLSWPIDLKTAVLGGKITVPTPKGDVTVNVPAHSDSGSILRLRGRGVQGHGKREAGNLYVTLNVVIGKTDQALEEFLQQWQPGSSTTQKTTG